MSKRTVKITLDPSHQHTPSLNCYRLVDATELWAPERPDTGTVSSLKQSISWTLDNNTQHYYTLFIHHTCLFWFQICTFHTCTYIIVYIINCIFAILYIAYLYSILCYLCPVLSHSVALWSFCHDNIPRMCKHTWQYSSIQFSFSFSLIIFCHNYKIQKRLFCWVICDWSIECKIIFVLNCLKRRKHCVYELHGAPWPYCEFSPENSFHPPSIFVHKYVHKF